MGMYIPPGRWAISWLFPGASVVVARWRGRRGAEATRWRIEGQLTPVRDHAKLVEPGEVPARR